MAQFHIGTAGWSYLRWDKEFYPEDVSSDEKLAFYAKCFNAVELNNSFYQVPSGKQFTVWEGQTPTRFQFAVKASRYITHTKKLIEPAKTLPRFLDAIGGQRKAGPVFFQLPPTFPVNLDRLEAFLKRLPDHHRYAFELRDPSWHDPAVYALLKRYKAAFCLYDTPDGISPRNLTTDFAYVRLRGRKQRQLSKFLGEWHTWLSDHTKRAYVFFDNREDKSLAFGNALAFRDIDKTKSSS